MAATALITTGDTSARLGPAPRRRGARDFFSRLPLRFFIVVLLIIEIYPMLWMFLGSFKTQNEFLNEPFWTLPNSWSLQNYVEIFTTGNFGQYIINSILVVFPSLFVILLFGVAAGFALEVMIWKGRGTVLLLFLIGIMVPTQMILLPLFSLYFQTGLTGTLWPLILTYIATGMPLTVFMMATFFRAIPREMFEAATLDGAGILRSFWSVGLPAHAQRDLHRRTRAVLLPLERPAHRADLHELAAACARSRWGCSTSPASTAPSSTVRRSPPSRSACSARC